jgi:hypothetical protein
LLLLLLLPLLLLLLPLCLLQINQLSLVILVAAVEVVVVVLPLLLLPVIGSWLLLWYRGTRSPSVMMVSPAVLVLVGLVGMTTMSERAHALDNGMGQTPPLGWSSW